MAKSRLSREESRQQTRDRLLTAAAQVFAERGFNGASVEDIAEAAGYSKGAVYSNFASKEDLFLALIDQGLEMEIEKLGDTLDLAVWEAEFARELTENRTLNLLTVEFFLYAMRNESAREKLAQRYRRGYEVLARLLESHYQQTQTPIPLPPNDLAWVFTAFGAGLFLQTCIDPAAAPEGLYRAGLEQLLYGSGSPTQNQ